MKILGMGREKAVAFPQFRYMVRTTLLDNDPQITVDITDSGLALNMSGAMIPCNLKNLYDAYVKVPANYNALVDAWRASLITTAEDQTWTEAEPILRPYLKDTLYLQQAYAQMEQQTIPDVLPYVPFAGDLHVILIRDLPGKVAAVTKRQLDEWGHTFNEAMRIGMTHMDMLKFPPVESVLTAHSDTPKRGVTGLLRGHKDTPEERQERGLVFCGDHLTASWIINERFRAHLSDRLQADYVVALPARNKLIAARTDDPGLLQMVKDAAAGTTNNAHRLSATCLHVNAAQTGGMVTVYHSGSTGPTSSAAPGSDQKSDRSKQVWLGLTETTSE